MKTKSKKRRLTGVTKAVREFFAMIGPEKAASTPCKTVLDRLRKDGVVITSDGSFGVTWSVQRRKYLLANGWKPNGKKWRQKPDPLRSETGKINHYKMLIRYHYEEFPRSVHTTKVAENLRYTLEQKTGELMDAGLFQKAFDSIKKSMTYQTVTGRAGSDIIREPQTIDLTTDQMIVAFDFVKEIGSIELARQAVKALADLQVTCNV